MFTHLRGKPLPVDARECESSQGTETLWFREHRSSSTSGPRKIRENPCLPDPPDRRDRPPQRSIDLRSNASTFYYVPFIPLPPWKRINGLEALGDPWTRSTLTEFREFMGRSRGSLIEPCRRVRGHARIEFQNLALSLGLGSFVGRRRGLPMCDIWSHCDWSLKLEDLVAVKWFCFVLWFRKIGPDRNLMKKTGDSAIAGPSEK